MSNSKLVTYKVSVPKTPNVVRYYPEKGADAHYVTFPGLTVDWLKDHAKVSDELGTLEDVAMARLLSDVAGTLRNKRGDDKAAYTASTKEKTIAAFMRNVVFSFEPQDLPTVSLADVRAKAEAAGLSGLSDEQIRSLAGTFYPGNIVTD